MKEEFKTKNESIIVLEEIIESSFVKSVFSKQDIK